MTAPTRATQRAKVATLAAQDVPSREIARRTGIPESTVRRWRTTSAPVAHPAAPPSAPSGAPPAAPDHAPPGAPGDAARGAGGGAPVTQDGAPAGAPAAPPHFAFALDDETRTHLALLAAAGHDPQTAITTALNLLANAYAYAWDYGLAPRGTAPQLRVQIRGDSPPPWPATTGSTQPGVR